MGIYSGVVPGWDPEADAFVATGAEGKTAFIQNWIHKIGQLDRPLLQTDDWRLPAFESYKKSDHVQTVEAIVVLCLHGNLPG